MQKHIPNFLLCTILFLTPISTHAQVSGYRLQKADSLFNAKRYTQALQQYEGIVNNREYTPALLLKMAYIHEGLGHIAQTQYFLSLYFQSTHDNSVLEKMSELAKKNKLEGYNDLTDQGRILNLYHQHSAPVTAVLLALLTLLASLILVAKRRSGKRPIPAFAAFISVVALLLVHLHYSEEETLSIVMTPNTYLMSGPSAGAEVITILDEGHRFAVTNKKDVWLKVRWREQDAYLKEGTLQEASL
jgi:hypothetical protein